MRRLCFVLSATLIFALAIAEPAAATFPARNALISFSAQTDDGIQVFTVRANGRDLRQIAHLDGDALSVDWSPDGRRIAFELVHDPDVDCDIVVVDADGSHIQVF